MMVRKDKVDTHKSTEVICPRGEVLQYTVTNVLQNNKRNNNAGIVREVPHRRPNV